MKKLTHKQNQKILTGISIVAGITIVAIVGISLYEDYVLEQQRVEDYNKASRQILSDDPFDVEDFTQGTELDYESVKTHDEKLDEVLAILKTMNIGEPCIFFYEQINGTYQKSILNPDDCIDTIEELEDFKTVIESLKTESYASGHGVITPMIPEYEDEPFEENFQEDYLS